MTALEPLADVGYRRAPACGAQIDAPTRCGAGGLEHRCVVEAGFCGHAGRHQCGCGATWPVGAGDVRADDRCHGCEGPLRRWEPGVFCDGCLARAEDPTVAPGPVMLRLLRWEDPLLAAHGHHVASAYAETFWLPVIGPTALWLLRHVERVTAVGPYLVEASVLARALGLGAGVGPSSPLMRTLHRLGHDGVVRRRGGDCWALPTHLGWLPSRRVRRLPEDLQVVHGRLR